MLIQIFYINQYKFDPNSLSEINKIKQIKFPKETKIPNKNLMYET